MVPPLMDRNLPGVVSQTPARTFSSSERSTSQFLNFAFPSMTRSGSGPPSRAVPRSSYLKKVRLLMRDGPLLNKENSDGADSDLRAIAKAREAEGRGVDGWLLAGDQARGKLPRARARAETMAAESSSEHKALDLVDRRNNRHGVWRAIDVGPPSLGHRHILQRGVEPLEAADQVADRPLVRRGIENADLLERRLLVETPAAQRFRTAEERTADAELHRLDPLHEHR